MDSSYKQRDFELISKINKGDTAAFRELIFIYKDVSLSLAFSILKNKVLAEDILQDVFVKVYEKLNTFKFKSSFKTWLYRIVVNTCYNEIKKAKNNTIPLDDNLNISVLDRSRLSETEQRKYINFALEKLRPDESLVLRLHYLCELSIKEIEEITGFKSSKIKVDLHRGRDNMHFQLKQLLGDDLKHLL